MKEDHFGLPQQEDLKFSEVHRSLNILKRYRRLGFNPAFVSIEIVPLVLVCLYIATRWNHTLLIIAVAVTAMFGTQRARYGRAMCRARMAILEANKDCISTDMSGKIELLQPLEEYHELFSLQATQIGNALWTEGNSVIISQAAEEVIIRYSTPPVTVKFSSQNLNHYTFMTRVVPYLHTSNLLSTPSRFADSIKFSAEKFNYTFIKEFFQQANSVRVSVPTQNKREQNDHSDNHNMINSSRRWRIYHFQTIMEDRLMQIVGLLLVLLICGTFCLPFVITSSEMYTAVFDRILLTCLVSFVFFGILLCVNSILKAFIPLSRIAQIAMKYALTGEVCILGTMLEQLKNHMGYLNIPIQDGIHQSHVKFTDVKRILHNSFFDDIRSSTIMLLAQVNDETSTNLTQVQRRILEQMLINDNYAGSTSYPKMSYFTMVTANDPIKLTHYAAHALGYLGDKSSLPVLKKIMDRTTDISLEQIASDAIVRLDHKLEVGDSYLLRSSQISNSSKDLLSISLPHDDLDEEKQTLNNRSIE